MRHWDLHQVAAGSRAAALDLATLEERTVELSALPYVAVRRGQPPPAGSVRAFPDYREQHLSLLTGIDAALAWDSDGILIALGLPGSTYSEDDPLFAELRKCAAAGVQVVVAAGNFGPSQGTLSALAQVPGVVSVTATDSAASRQLLQSSSRGSPQGPWPTISSDGEDRVIVVGGPSYGSGTSFAAGRLARMCLFLRCMVRWMAECQERDAAQGPPPLPPRAVLTQLDTLTSPTGLTDLGLGVDVDATLGDAERCHAWLRRVSTRFAEIELPHTVSWTPAGVTRLIQRLAEEMPDVEPWECGAGILDENLMRRHLLELTPMRFLALFADEDQMSLAQPFVVEDLNRELGVLWTWEDYSAWMEYYGSLRYVVVAYE